MKAKQIKAMDMLISGNYTTCEIAEELKISRKTLYNWRTDEEFDAEFRHRLSLKLGAIAPKAVKRIDKLIDSETERIALDASRDILDRTGFKADTGLNISGALPVVISGGDELED